MKLVHIHTYNEKEAERTPVEHERNNILIIYEQIGKRIKWIFIIVIKRFQTNFSFHP